MGTTVQLNSDFDLPAYRTGLEVLLLLAEAINEVFSSQQTMDLLDGSEHGNWIELLRLLGDLNVDPQCRVSQTTHIGDLWDAFFHQNDVKNLETQLLGVFQAVRDKSVARAKSGNPITVYLDATNKLGHNIVTKILKKRDVEQLITPDPIPVEVFYDGPGGQYCAGSSLWTNKIRWAYQPVPHSLWGALLADLVFAHEYLSHLVPRNKYLGSTVREQWLVAALRRALEEDKLVLYWKIRLWTPYRSALESHVTKLARILQPDASVVRYSGLQGAEENLRWLDIKHTKLFWRLTVEILRSKNDREIAAKAAHIAERLAHRGVPAIDERKVHSISELDEYLTQ
jgi:hypothetical protein